MPKKTELVKDVDNAARHPFQWYAFPKLPALTLSQSLNPIKVPKGKRLVIEFASARAIIQAIGQIAEVGISSTVNKSVGNYFVPLMRTGTVGNKEERFLGSQLMRIYADAGTDVGVGVGRTDPGTGIASFDVSISGYFVDLP